MNCHVRNMVCLPQRSQAKLSIILSCLILFVFVQATVSCKTEKCSQRLQLGLKLTRFTRKKTADVLETYKASQGDSTDLICEMQMDNVPVSTISGQTAPERISSLYTRLKEFLPHLNAVKQQQKDLDPPSNPVSEGLDKLITHVDRLSMRVNCLLENLQPNIPIPEPAETEIPPAQNIFQQKAYGCIVLSRLQQLLSQAVQEQKSLKRNICRKRTKTKIF